MIYEKIRLKDYFPSINSEATLTCYSISNHNEYPYDVNRRSILVIPGGGYEFVSFREAEPIALKFLAHNFNVFVLDYSVLDFKFPYPMIEAYASIAYIRQNKEKYHVDGNSVGVVGFSAGGHLAATISNYQKEEQYASMLSVDQDDLRIDFTILSYPVISMDDSISHLATRYHISQNIPELLDYFSIDLHVNDYFPKTFIWTTKTDDIVPYIHSVMMKEALDKKGIKNEFHLFEKGPHGGATCDDLSCDPETSKILLEASKWIDLAVDFIKNK